MPTVGVIALDTGDVLGDSCTLPRSLALLYRTRKLPLICAHCLTAVQHATCGLVWPASVCSTTPIRLLITGDRVPSACLVKYYHPHCAHLLATPSLPGNISAMVQVTVFLLQRTSQSAPITLSLPSGTHVWQVIDSVHQHLMLLGRGGLSTYCLINRIPRHALLLPAVTTFFFPRGAQPSNPLRILEYCPCQPQLYPHAKFRLPPYVIRLSVKAALTRNSSLTPHGNILRVQAL